MTISFPLPASLACDFSTAGKVWRSRMYQPPERTEKSWFFSNSESLGVQEPLPLLCFSAYIHPGALRDPLSLVDKPHISVADAWLSDSKCPVSFPRKEMNCLEHLVGGSWLVHCPHLQGRLFLYSHLSWDAVAGRKGKSGGNE